MSCDPDRLQEFVEESGLSFGQNSVSFIFTCPKCSKNKAYVRKRDGRFICFRCSEETGYKGRPELLFADLLQTSFAEVKKELYGSNVTTTDAPGFAFALDEFFGPDDEIDLDVEFIPTVRWPHDFYLLDHPFAARGVAYLENERGIPLEVAKQYGIRYAPSRQSVIFPVEMEGRLVGYQSRLVTETRFWDEDKHEYHEVLKTRTLTGTPKGQIVMFANRLKGSPHAVVCEGPIDAVKAHLCGGNVATMGKGVQPRQRAFLRASGVRRLYLALDPDAAKSTRELCDEFADLEICLLQAPKPYKDLGAMPLQAVKDLFDAARPFVRTKTGRLFKFFG